MTAWVVVVSGKRPFGAGRRDSTAHLGGTAATPMADRVLLGHPDILIIGVGGGAKVPAREAAEVVRDLNPAGFPFSM